MKKISLIIAVVMVFVSVFTACNESKTEIIIYTSSEDFRIEYVENKMEERFPDYNVVIEYMSTSNIAAKIKTEGKNTACDIIWSLEYGYLDQLNADGLVAPLSATAIDNSIYSEDTLNDNWTVDIRNGGAIILNTKVLADRGLAEPESYADLLKPEYKGLISMPSPKSSGTGYTFLYALVKSMGEDAAFDYFDKLSENILQYTASGSGPVNALMQNEVAIGLGITAQAVTKINEGADNLKIKFFEEGSPYALYGNAIVSGKETRNEVVEVFEYLATTCVSEINELYFPENIMKDKYPVVENFPTNIKYSDMSGDNMAEKQRLLDKWKY